MEDDKKMQNDFGASRRQDIATDIMGGWRRASLVEGVAQMHDIDSQRSNLDMGIMSGTGFAFPGTRASRPVSNQNIVSQDDDNRATSFNNLSDSD